MKTKPLIILLSLAALGLSPLSTLVPVGGMDAAYAGSGNGNSGGNGNGGGKSGDKSSKGTKADKATTAKKAKAGTGAIASELKGLNAYHASATAFENAAPNSQVGRIATYREAAMATQDAGAAVDDAGLALGAAEQTLSDAQEAYDAAALSGTATQEELDALQADIDAAQDDMDLAQTDYDTAVEEAGALTAAEEEALLEASNGRILSRGTIEYLREQLGITDTAETQG